MEKKKAKFIINFLFYLQFKKTHNTFHFAKTFFECTANYLTLHKDQVQSCHQMEYASQLLYHLEEQYYVLQVPINEE